MPQLDRATFILEFFPLLFAILLILLLLWFSNVLYVFLFTRFSSFFFLFSAFSLVRVSLPWSAQIIGGPLLFLSWHISNEELPRKRAGFSWVL
jgi:hypothetical protein